MIERFFHETSSRIVFPDILSQQTVLPVSFFRRPLAISAQGVVEAGDNRIVGQRLGIVAGLETVVNDFVQSAQLIVNIIHDDSVCLPLLIELARQGRGHRRVARIGNMAQTSCRFASASLHKWLMACSSMFTWFPLNVWKFV
jgi:hypothetical protein